MPPRRQLQSATRSSRAAAKNKPDTILSPDVLATRLAEALTISDAKGKQKAAHAETIEDRCTNAMRIVNSASKNLSGIIDSGWKRSTSVAPTRKPASPGSQSVHTVSEVASGASKAIDILRELKPQEVDIERAASSLTSKLISLEMYDIALDMLAHMHPNLPSFYRPRDPTSSSNVRARAEVSTMDRLNMLSLPLPSSNDTLGKTVLILVSTYLLHAIIVISHHVLSNPPTTVTKDFPLLLADCLCNSPTLIQWLPILSSLPLQHRDTVLTRAYTALVKSTSLQPNGLHSCSATSMYRIRMYGILCLANTSPSVLEPAKFWNQVVTFTMSFVKDLGPAPTSPPSKTVAAEPKKEEDATGLILKAFADTVACVGLRSDAESFQCGDGFVAFCEYWMGFAKRVGYVSALKQISSLMASASSRSPSATHPSEAQVNTDKPQESHSAAEAARLCAVFAQATAVLDQSGSAFNDDQSECLHDVTAAIPQSHAFLCLVHKQGRSTEARGADKVRKSFEQLRRAVTKIVENISPTSSSPHKEPLTLVTTILEKIIEVLANVIREVQTSDPELLTPVLDSIFVLARTSLTVSRIDTYNRSFDLLSRAASLIPKTGDGTRKRDSAEVASCANYTRCASGAFYNLAGVLYQAGRHSHAVRFLERACTLGNNALQQHRSVRLEGEFKQPEDGWTQLEEQLYRKWELLGVCHSKTGDRRSAHNAFTESIKTFPFHQPGFVKLASTSGLSTLFESQYKHIAALIDRVTYAGIADLFLGPSALSLKTICQDNIFCTSDAATQQDWKASTGAVLERQVEGLEGSRWKDNVRGVIPTLLSDALDVYDSAEMPVRRARVLLKCLETAYYTNTEITTLVAGLHLTEENIVDQIEGLLTREDLGRDAGLARLCPHYRVTLHLWLAHHAHRKADSSQISRIVVHAEQACSILKNMLGTIPRPSLPRSSLPRPSLLRQSPAKMKSPKQVAASKKTAPKGALAPRPLTVKTASRRTKHIKTEPVTPKPKESLPSNAVVPPSRLSLSGQSTLVFDDVSKLISLLAMTSQLLGLLGRIVNRVHLLSVTRRLCERCLESRTDDYVRASVDLAHEYVKLGKTQKAGSIYGHALKTVRDANIDEKTRVIYFLRYAESLAAVGNVLESSSAYCEAAALCKSIVTDEKGSSTAERVKARVQSLERAAVAASTFGVIQYSADEPALSINGLLQSLRLWNRAFDALARLLPPAPSTKDPGSPNPFEMTDVKEALPDTSGSGSRIEQPPLRKIPQRRAALDGLEWRIAEGLLGALFSLIQAYFARGSPREAEYFVQQARDLAESLNVPGMASRALARLGEILLYQGRAEDSHQVLSQAADLVADSSSPEAADILRLRGTYSQLSSNRHDAQQMYDAAMTMLAELDKLFFAIDGTTTGARKSVGLSPRVPQAHRTSDTSMPQLLVAVLRQNIWLLHNAGEEYQGLLEQLQNLPSTVETKAEENALLAKLTLDDACTRFGADMFLSSLTESTITIPMGMSGDKFPSSPAVQDILGSLNSAEKLFWSDLALISRRGNVGHVRGAAISLALIRAFQTSLGKAGRGSATLAARLLDYCTAITLRREMLEVIPRKFPDVLTRDDLQWPLITANGTALPPPKTRADVRFSLDPEDDCLLHLSVRKYWDHLASKYQAQGCDPAVLSTSQCDALPANWTVISITITDDRNTMLVTRQRAHQEPLIFCMPLKGRRDSEDDEHLTVDDALNELKEIIRISDDGTRRAANVRKDDRTARAAWWAERTDLDRRLQQLLENIEFCWLGAFKTILSEPAPVSAKDLGAFRIRLEKVFKRIVISQDKKQKTRIRLNDHLLECFSLLSPKCRDEELEDLIYFVLDLYQFHGVPVAIAEVDMDQVVVDLRGALEEHGAQLKARQRDPQDNHTFLVLDRVVQGIPWESIPSLRGRSVSRIPSMDFLLDRLDLVQSQQRGERRPSSVDRAPVDPRKTSFILNPSGDLKNTEGRFATWLKEMRGVGWDGIVGRAPSEQQFADMLSQRDLIIYFGHGGGEQYIRAHKIRDLPRCAATMLWGCSSGAMREMGDFDRTGTPHNYMLAGCPTLVANLWDVTDRDIDKFSQSVFDQLRLTVHGVRAWPPEDVSSGTSIVTAVAHARQSCKLKYLTGAAPVVYGIPFYL